MEQKQLGDTHIPHRAQRQHQQPKLNSSHTQFKQVAMLEPFTQSNQSAPGTQSTAGAKLACKAHTGTCAQGHHGTSSLKPH